MRPLNRSDIGVAEVSFRPERTQVEDGLDHRKGSGSHNRSEPTAMKFGIHNSSWLDRPDPAEAFEAVRGKAQRAENHRVVWVSGMDAMIQIPPAGAPDGAGLEGWSVLARRGRRPRPVPP